MTQIAEKLKTELAGLSQKERADLACFLLQTLDDENEEEITDDEFLAELNRRMEEVTSGRDPGRPVEEVLVELREKYP